MFRNWNSTSWAYFSLAWLCAMIGAGVADTAHIFFPPYGGFGAILGLGMAAALCRLVIAPAIRERDNKRMNVAANTEAAHRRWEAFMATPFDISIILQTPDGAPPHVVYLGDMPRRDAMREFGIVGAGIMHDHCSGVTINIANGVQIEPDMIDGAVLPSFPVVKNFSP